MVDRARHAFGALENVDTALSNNTIDAFDILFLKDATGKPYVGWIDKDGNKVIVEETEKVVTIESESLPETGEEGKIYIFDENGYFWNGKEFVNLCKPTDVSALEAKIETKVDADAVETMIKTAVDDAIIAEVIEF